MTVTATEPAYRGFRVHVARTRRLSPTFLRMTFTGPDLDEFGTAGLDQRIKLVLPVGCGVPVDPTLFDDPEWYARWRAMPDAERNPIRTYTVRAVRPAQREVDVDVVLHGVRPGAVTTRGCGLAQLLGCACDAPGPAVRWCAAARPGDPLVLIGPNGRYHGPPSGIEWRPPAEARRFLLAGDETAVPAICAILERLPADAVGEAFCEVATVHDVLDVAAPAGVTVHWLARDEQHRVGGGPAAYGVRLAAAVRHAATRLAVAHHAGVAPEDVAGPVPAADDPDGVLLWDVPEEASAPDGLYAWVAGEAGMVRDLRRFLVADVGLDRRAVAFMGYWREGRPAAA